MADQILGGGLAGLEIVVSVGVGVAAGAIAQVLISKVYKPKKESGISTLISSALSTGLALMIGVPLIQLVANDPLSQAAGVSSMINMLTMGAQYWVENEISKEV